MSGTQSTLGLLARPGKWNLVENIKDAANTIADDLGLDFDAFTARPGELPDNVGIVRYQYVTTYEWCQRDQSTGDTEVGDVEFRTTFYSLTDPSDRVKTHLRNVTHHRTRALFDLTDEYAGYMDGFNFVRKNQNVEIDRAVGQDEIPPTGLGVPNFGVIVHDTDGDIVGYSKGYSLDMGITEQNVSTPDAPAQEVWRFGNLNSARNDYELKPKASSPARERAKNAKGKTAYINGMPVGTITSRGTVWVSREHKSPAQATYRSRREIIENTSTPYQALQPNAKFYKVRETSDGLYFSTVEPTNFNETDPDAISEDQTGFDFTEAALDISDDPTEFVVTADVADPWALGKYDTVLTKTIPNGTDFQLHTPTNPIP